MKALGPVATVIGLGAGQALAWASSFYLPAVLAEPIARDLQVPAAMVFAAFSLALVVSAVVGPAAGRAVDRHGGRPVLLVSNLLFAAGLVALAGSAGARGLFAAWALLGMAMGAGLYEVAFATLVRAHGLQARRAITGVTLIAGFASTIGWPLSAWLAGEVGWRIACLVWAALHLAGGLPLNAALPVAAVDRADPMPSASAKTPAGEGPARSVPRYVGWMLAVVFASVWFTSTAMAAHLPRLLTAAGIAVTMAVAISALVGPAQVAGRLMEFTLLRRLHPLLSAQLATLAHPVGAACLLLAASPSSAIAFAILHGAGNGLLTIVMGTLPLVIFGASGYGMRQGLLMIPARITQAVAPFAFGLCVERWGSDALAVTTVLGVFACSALLALGWGGRLLAHGDARTLHERGTA